MSPATASVIIMATATLVIVARATWRATRGPVWGNRWGEPDQLEVPDGRP